MLSKATVKQLRAAHYLTQQAFYSDLRAAVEAELVVLFERLSESQNVALLHQFQGRAQALKEFLKFLETSKDVLEKIERSPSGARG
jgi:hypothetical protein